MLLIQAVVNNGFPSEIEENSKAEYNLYEILREEDLLEKLEHVEVSGNTNNAVYKLSKENDSLSNTKN